MEQPKKKKQDKRELRVILLSPLLIVLAVVVLVFVGFTLCLLAMLAAITQETGILVLLLINLFLVAFGLIAAAKIGQRSALLIRRTIGIYRERQRKWFVEAENPSSLEEEGGSPEEDEDQQKRRHQCKATGEESQ